MSQNEWLAIAPFLIVSGLAILVVLVDLMWPRRDTLATGVTVVGILAAMAVTIVGGPLPWGGQLPVGGQEVFGGVYVRDELTAFLDLVFLSIALLTILFAPDYLVPRGLPMAEFSATLLFAIAGAMLLGGGRDVLILFLGLELLVLPGYMLAAFAKRDGLSTEGAIKYFLLGSFSSAILLFGIALTFGYVGATRVGAIAERLAAVASGEAPLAIGLAMGLALMSVGVAFKIAAVPFHYWTPDAYQGSPTPVTGYLSVGPKVAAFALILRLFVEALAPLRGEWALLVGILAALTMTVGNLAALGQDNIKRMLAYSSIAQTGYIMVGLAVYAAATDPATQATGLQGVLFYSGAYAFMNLGAFACVAALQRRPGVTSQISSFAGLGRDLGTFQFSVEVARLHRSVKLPLGREHAVLVRERLAMVFRVDNVVAELRPLLFDELLPAGIGPLLLFRRRRGDRRRFDLRGRCFGGGGGDVFARFRRMGSNRVVWNRLGELRIGRASHGRW